MRKIYILITLGFTSLFFGQAQTYHDTQGKLEVTNSGQSTYTLPIALPPSIQDVGPTLNLVYASGQNGGIAGQGWNINNISYISRISTRQDIDGFKDGVDFDENDKLALDGQRLLIKSGTYWADGSTYETEVQSNTKIELKGSGTSMYFIVTTPDGSRSWYGNYGGMNATDLSAYYITRFEDADGNFILYNYVLNSTNCIYISNIEFSANVNSNTNALNKIQFNYETIQRKETSYLKGLKIIRDKILKNIEVFTNNLSFRKYFITHSIDSEGYQRVSSIQEANGAGELANPVAFEYFTPTYDYYGNPNTYFSTTYSSQINLNNISLGGDFDGDGSLDFISDNNLYTKMDFSGSNNNVAPIPFTYTNRNIFATTVKSGNKLNQFQSIVKVNELPTFTEFWIYDKNPDVAPYMPGLHVNYSRYVGLPNSIYHDTTLDEHNTGNCQGPAPWDNQCFEPSQKTSSEYLHGDFNADGIGEVLIVSKKNERYYNVETDIYGDGYYGDGYTCYTNITNDGEEIYYVNLDIDGSYNLGENGFVKLDINSVDLENSKKMIADFNGDGKSDLIIIKSDKTYKVIAINQLTVSPWVQTEIIGQGLIPQYSSTKQILLGDFNGDGKTDIILPNQDGNGCEDQSYCDDWTIYFNNPKLSTGEMFEAQQFDIIRYMPRRDYTYSTIFNSYYALDINSDGKTDLLKIERAFVSGGDNRWYVDGYINRIDYSGSAPFIAQNYIHHIAGITPPIPVVMKDNYSNGLYRDVLLVDTNNHVESIRFGRDLNRENNLIKVLNSNQSIVDEITYRALVYNQSAYSSLDELNYPFVEIKNNPNIYAVTNLKNTTQGISKWQDFQYRGLSVNLNSFGVIGFIKTARSAWFDSLDYNTTKMIWSCSENDITKRGANIRNYTLSFYSRNFNVLLDPGNFTSGVFGGNWKLLSKTDNNYTVSTTPFPYVILLQSQKTKDYLTNVVKETIYNSYSSDYKLPTSVTTNNYLGTTLQGSTLTETTYDSNVSGEGSSYYIGRPLTITNTNTAYNNIKKSLQTFDYINGNVWHIYKNVYENNSTTILDPVTLVETMSYFPNGLLKDKEISATGTTATNAVSARKTSYTYDPTNRFVKTTTDTEMMVTTNLTYHPIYGTVLTQQNPYNQISTNVYDNWGKRTKITDFLGKSINYNYSRANNIYTTTQIGDDGSESKIEQDVLAREIRKGSKNINGNWSFVNTEYDNWGRKYRESEPYFDNETPKWSTISYDDYSRPIQVNAYTGKVITTTYNGLTTTTNDGILIKTSTKNSNDHLVSSSEVGTSGGASGGTITYTYDALGNLLTSLYDGSTVTLQYDLWGRKASINDPSAGLHTYTYNAYGEILKETSPKGFTDYTYTPTGKILTKWVKDAVTPLNTNINTTYNYDPTYKWISSMSVVNPFDGNSTYTYTYDIGTANGFTNTKQLKKTVETLTPTGAGTVTFTKDLSFDAFGRVLTETSTAAAHGNTSTKTITNSYINGELYQIFDGATATGTPIWKANTLNARGQLLTGSLGNGINISNEYDQFGYPKKIKHDRVGTNPLNITTLEYTFTPSTGNLEERKNTNVFERNFTLELYNYDKLDRLDGDAFVDYNYYNFDNGNDGFLPIGGCFLSNVNGKLKVDLNSINSGVEKLIKTVSKAGENIQIEFEMTPFEDCNQFTPFLCNNADLRCSLYEKDPSTGAINVLGDNLAVEMYGSMFLTQNSNKNIYLKFYILQSNNGYNPKFKFTLDNVIYSVQPDDYTYQTYHNSGKINANYLGTYNYNKITAAPPKPYQNTSVTLTDEGKVFYGSKSGQVISYNAIQRPIQISEGNQKIDFGYNTMQQRMVMYYGNANANKTLRPYRKYYSADGSMEINYTLPVTTTPTAPAKVEFFTYIGGDAYSAPIVNRKIDTATSENFYLHRDYLGSILAITNSVGAVVEKRAFDAWGNITKVQDGAGNNLNKLTFFDRGYTGHEHLQAVGLINMNARLYDPKLRRLLQPDNYIQDPTSTQDYNRYAYAHNNPLKYNDPTGNFGVAAAIIIGAVISISTYLISSSVNHTPITFQGVIMSGVMGAFTGAATFGIGEAFSTVANFYTQASYSAHAHGAFQGGMSYIHGGKFWSSFAAGCISSLASSAWQGGDSTGGIHHRGISGATGLNNGAGTIVFGTISGGAGAALAGGNFWQGAVTGLVVSGLNHALHDKPNNKLIKKLNREIKNAFGDRADSELPYGGATDEDVDTALNLDTIKTIRNNSGNPSVVNMHEDNDADGTYKSAAEEFGAGLKAAQPGQAGTIRLYSGAFLSPRHLVHTILHELGHAYSRYTGYFLKSYKSYGWTNAIALDEVFAYSWGSSFGNSMFVSPGTYQKGLGKALKTLNYKK